MSPATTTTGYAIFVFHLDSNKNLQNDFFPPASFGILEANDHFEIKITVQN